MIFEHTQHIERDFIINIVIIKTEQHYISKKKYSVERKNYLK